MEHSPDNLSISNAVVVFAKPPFRGEVKTRLTGRLDEKRATDLYRAFLDDTAARVSDFARSCDYPVTPILAYTEEPEHPGFEVFQERDYLFVEQSGGDLGDKMYGVVDGCFDHGADRVVITGSDSPTLLDRHLGRAFETLQKHDVAVGPSNDGGYYLMGLRSSTRTLFERIEWSTRSVLRETLRRAREDELECELLEFWYDIDTYDDLYRLHTHLLEYLAREDHTIAPRTTEMLRRLEAEGLFDVDAS
jgi:rSAM/selenodomain-associated transferase 1